MPFPFASLLLDWYSQHARALPWRVNQASAGLADNRPYAVWVSEIMLQQTRVETVIPYFLRWIERFPTVSKLAQASQDEVLKVWEGLGYYSRARSLHRAAQIVCSDYGGQIPRDLQALRRLPGIGRYMAAAIASIAFGLDVAALDGNIRRVLARYFDVAEPARSPGGEQRLWELAAANLPAGKAGAYNQALMDLGATLCTPHTPDCAHCPVMGGCLAFVRGVQEQRPVLLSKRQIPHYQVTAAVIRQDGYVLIARRPPRGLLGGLWEFPGGKQQEGEDLPACLRREIREELGVEVAVEEPLGVYRYAYTHFRVTLHAFQCAITHGEPQSIQASDIRWVKPGDLPDYPMGKIDRQIAGKLSDADNPVSFERIQ